LALDHLGFDAPQFALLLCSGINDSRANNEPSAGMDPDAGIGWTRHILQTLALCSRRPSGRISNSISRQNRCRLDSPTLWMARDARLSEYLKARSCNTTGGRQLSLSLHRLDDDQVRVRGKFWSKPYDPSALVEAVKTLMLF